MGALLGTSDVVVYCIIAVGVFSLISIIGMFIVLSKVKKLNKRIDELTRGKDVQSMEDIILNFFERIEKLESAEERISLDIEKIKNKLKTTYQKSGLVKYDAFREMSGALSYSLALLDQENNGVLITSMYSREGCYTYAKEILNGESKLNLSEEEQDALKEAIAK